MKIVLVSGLMVLGFAGGCTKEEKETGKATGELQTVGTLAIAPPALTKPGMTNLTTAQQIKGTTDVDIESLKIPVFAINIAGSNNGGRIYQCSGSSADCLVELVGTDLTDLLTKGAKAPDDIEVGTFNSLSISYKPQGCSGAEADKSAPDLAATVRASAVYKGVTYYTNKAKGLSIAGPAEDVSFGFGACSSSTTLDPPVELTKGATINVKSFVDLQSQFSIQEKLSSQTSFCITDASLDVELCNNSVNIASNVSSKEPTLERYLVNPENSDQGCGGYMSVFYNDADVPFGGFLRVYRYEGQDCDVGGVLGNSSGGGLGVLKKNTDGTLTIKDATPDLNPQTEFSAFKRATHTGVVQAAQAFGEAKKDINYTAIKL